MATIRNGEAALLVIDLQNDVVAHAWKREEVVRTVALLIDDAREADVPVIFVQHEDQDLINGSEGWQFVEEIAPRDGEIVIAKRYQDAFVETDLPDVLERFDVSHLIVTGAQSMACIRATTHRALAEGYDLTLVADAHTTDDLDYDGVHLTAAQIIGYTNLCIQFMTYPNQEIRVMTHESVVFKEPTDAQESEHHVLAQ